MRSPAVLVPGFHASMIKPRKSKLFDFIFRPYCRNLLRRNFNSIRIKGLDELSVKGSPVLVISNHSSWWDGLIAYYVSKEADLDAYVMMEEKQLARFFLFRFLGAFSVVREKPQAAARSILYSIRLLNSKDAALWLFPQGKIVPFDSRPIEISDGAELIQKRVSGLKPVLVGMKYEYLQESKADVFVSAIALSEEIGPIKMESHLSQLSNDISNNELDQYTEILRKA